MTLRPRVIPVLLLRGNGICKGVRFRQHTYVGDPMNTVRLFNDKNVDELMLLDISATEENRITPLAMVEQIAEECHMPFGIGGGIRTVEQVRDILKAGAEKVAINTAAVETPDLVRRASDTFGAQSITVAIDARKRWWGGYRVMTRCGARRTALEPAAWAAEMEKQGAGEILLTAIAREGTWLGYDLDLIRAVTAAVTIPVIAAGGAGRLEDLDEAVRLGGAAAAAAGSLFVFKGRHRAVLVNYPDPAERDGLGTGRHA